jgi:cbb3-type cytochrome oxidase subunit 1
MKQIAFAFFALGAISVTLGMVWGIQMSATHNHTMSPAHAHLNLVGWVTFAIFGLYYHLVPAAAKSPLARIHLTLAVLGLVALVPGIVLAINETTEILAVAGSFLTLAAMLVFLWTVFRNRAPA